MAADKSIYDIAQRQQKLHRSLAIFVAVVAVLLPFLLYFLSVVSGQGVLSWSFEPLRESLASGRIFADPGVALFQQGQLIVSASSSTRVAGTVGSYVALGGLLFGTLFIIFAVGNVVLRIAAYRRVGQRLVRRTIFQSPRQFTPTTKLLRALAVTRGDVIEKPSRKWVVATAGRSVVVQTQVKEAMPFVLITSAKDSVQTREKLQLTDSKGDLVEVVKDAVSLEHFHSYITRQASYSGTPLVLNKNVAAILSKQLEGTDVIFENGCLTAVISSKTIGSDVDFDSKLDALDSIVKSQRALPAYGKIPQNNYLYRRAGVVREYRWLGVLVGFALLYGVVTFFIPQGPTVSDILVYSTFLGWACFWAFWHISQRRSNFMKDNTPVVNGGTL
jgi:hypothetical protein